MGLPGVVRIRDTCNVYLLVSGREAVAIDIGSGAVFDQLDELGLDRITDVLVTHHHRDGVQGLARAAAAGARIWVPPVEQELFTRVDEHWQARRVEDDYDLRQDRFSLLERVEIAGTVDEYRTRRYGGADVHALPTPGHTPGSLTYLVERDGRRLAFAGDLVYAAGKVWSLAATQWSYSGVEGQAATILSCGILAAREPDLLLPAHGEPIADPADALALTQARLTELMELRREAAAPWDLAGWLRAPWERLSPRLLRNRTSIATSYALLSETGAALLLDWGYDLWTGWPLGGERSTCRPLLHSVDALRDHGVTSVEAVVTTHYHDDHVAGINLLRDVHGTQAWAPANVAPILEDPRRYDLPCLWFDPVPVDRTLALEAPVRWHEYELTAYPLPGHTLFAAAIAFDVDGRRVLATGDQQGASMAGRRDVLNYQYRNRFRTADYVASAELYRRLRPDLIISGHWPPREVDDAYLDALLDDGRRVARLHEELLPGASFGPEGFGARIEPYTATVARGGELDVGVLVRNPLPHEARAEVRLALPAGWSAEPDGQTVDVGPRGEAEVQVHVRVGDDPVRRARIAADLTVGGVSFGQQAEALVDVA